MLARVNRAKTIIKMRNEGLKFPRIGAEFRISADRARQLYIWGVRWVNREQMYGLLREKALA